MDQCFGVYTSRSTLLVCKVAETRLLLVSETCGYGFS